MLLKIGNLICVNADFCKFYLQNIGYLLSAKKQKKHMYTKIHICLGKSEYHNRSFPFP